MKLKRDYLTIFYFIFSIQIFAQNGEFLDAQNSSEPTTNPTFSAVKNTHKTKKRESYSNFNPT